MSILTIAKPGSNVEASEKDLAFTSDRDCMIEELSGKKTVNGTGYVQHSLGYYPAYTTFAKKVTSDITGIPDNTWTPVMGMLGNAINLISSLSIDTDKLYFETYDETIEFYYSIFANKVDNQTGSGNTNVDGKLKIAKSGLSVPDINDARQFQFFSGKSVFKQDLEKSGEIEVEFNDYDLNIAEVTHGLGYVPIVYAFEADNGSRIPYATPGGNLFTYFIDSTKIYFLFGNFSSPALDPYTLKYKVLRDKIA